MKNASILFSFRHRQRDITVWRRGRSHFKRYIGAINGEVCAEGPAKGELLRQLIDMARHRPKASVKAVLHVPNNVEADAAMLFLPVTTGKIESRPATAGPGR